MRYSIILALVLPLLVAAAPTPIQVDDLSKRTPDELHALAERQPEAADGKSLSSRILPPSADSLPVERSIDVNVARAPQVTSSLHELGSADWRRQGSADWRRQDSADWRRQGSADWRRALPLSEFQEDGTADWRRDLPIPELQEDGTADWRRATVAGLDESNQEDATADWRRTVADLDNEDAATADWRRSSDLPPDHILGTADWRRSDSNPAE